MVWASDDLNDPDTVRFEREIYGQLLDVNTNEIGPDDVRLSDAGGLGSSDVRPDQPEVTVNLATGEYLVTWHANENDGGNNPSELNAIFGQRVSSSGEEIGDNDFLISDVSEPGDNVTRTGPTAVYNPSNDTFFVAFNEVTENEDGTIARQVFGQLLDSEGHRFQVDDFPISDEPDDFVGHGEIGLSYNALDDEFLVAWVGTDTDLRGPHEDGDAEIYGQRIDSLGRQIGQDDFYISVTPRRDGTRHILLPAVAWNSSLNQYLTVWQGSNSQHGLALNEFEIYGQRLSLYDEVLVDVSSAFNVDAVVNRVDDAIDPTQTQLESGLSFATQTAAQSMSSAAIGLPDDGVIPSSKSHPHVQLGARNDDNGVNAIALDPIGVSVGIPLSPIWLHELHLFAAATGGVANVEVFVSYSDGFSQTFEIEVPDWQSAIADTEDEYTLIGGLDRVSADGQRLDNTGSASIFGFRLETFGAQRAVEMRIRQVGGPGEAFVMGAAGVGTKPETIVVTTVQDEIDGDLRDEDISLREAIIMANRTRAPETIEFASDLVGESIDLEHGVLPVEATSPAFGFPFDLRIAGPSADKLTIDAQGQDRAFVVRQDRNVEISGLSLNDGQGIIGGAILNHGNLRLDGVAIRNSRATDGGAIFNHITGSLHIQDTELSGNSADIGGAIASLGEQFTMINSTVSGNASFRFGGGLTFPIGRSGTIVNSTITNNRADTGGSGFQFGGGIHSKNANIQLHNTIVAGNVVGPADNESADDVSGSLHESSAHNLIGVDVRLIGIADGAGSNQVGTLESPLDPMLGHLTNNGGPTQTHVLLTGSPAIDRGGHEFLESLPSPPIHDQRGPGFDRFVDSQPTSSLDRLAIVDIGAVEKVFSDIATIPGDSNRDGVFDSSDLVLVFQANEFEDAIAGNSTFEEGDWNGDGDFDTGDLVHAFQAGHFQKT